MAVMCAIDKQLPGGGADALSQAPHFHFALQSLRTGRNTSVALLSVHCQLLYSTSMIETDKR